MEYKIELVVSKVTSTTEQGKILENISSQVLASMQYEVIKEIRLTGMEVDLMAKHRVSGEEIYVECKAHKSTLSADVITKILGNIYINNISAGWLITTGPLGKDAKGLMKQWEEKDANERRKLSIYTNERLIDLLVSSGSIISVQNIEMENKKTYRDESILLICNYGNFWLKIETVDGSSISKGVACYNAKTGQKIMDEELLDKLKELDTEYQTLEWKHNQNEYLNQIEGEIESIVEVSGGDEWADYRPSRPIDFVGREELRENILEYFNKVVEAKSGTRLFSITAPSGWGKSSFLLYIYNEISKKKFCEHYFMYSVDVRAAISSRYAEFAILECFRKAINCGFITQPKNDITYCGAAAPFEHTSFEEIFAQLKKEKKLIILCFDQFEETFSKKELMTLFENIKKISINIDSIKENFILGFAWKTDVVIPVEHPAYHMWHNLSDRRMNSELTIFSKKEIVKAIDIFSKQLNQPINKILKEYLIDQCQGYPWLLKKLCIHVYKLVKNGINQSDIIGQSLKIEDLFEKDLNELSAQEQSCINKIANETPADYYKIHDIFGEKTIQALINKRLVLRKGQRLILYWDIFRDYVLNGDIPKILLYYIPQINHAKFIDSIMYMEINKRVIFNNFAEGIGISATTAQNIVKDLIMFGVVERDKDEIVFSAKDKSAALKKVIEFFDNHIVFNIVKKYSEVSQLVPKEKIKEEFYSVHAYSHVANKSKEIYFNKILSWLISLGYIETQGEYVKRTQNLIQIEFVESKNYMARYRKPEFLGQGTYGKVIEVLNKIKDGSVKCAYRNEISLLRGLGIIVKVDNDYILTISPENCEIEVKERVKETEAIRIVYELADKIGVDKLTSELVGEHLRDRLNKKKWKSSSVIRNGGAVLRWYRYIYGV